MPDDYWRFTQEQVDDTVIGGSVLGELKMPHRPQPPCSYPGCPTRAVHQGRCAKHQRLRAPDNRPSRQARGYGADWQRKRRAHLAAYPWCQAIGCAAPGTHVDHILPRSLGGSDDESNLQTLCASHHSRKTARRDGGFGNRKR